METGIYDLVEKILYGVSFIAIGGTVGVIFFFVFAPSILGSKTIHRQLQILQKESEKINEQLEKISERLGNARESSEKEP